MHVVCPCVGFEVLIDVVAHMFDRVVGFFLASRVHNRIMRLGMLRHKVMGIFLVLLIVYAIVVQWG